LKAEGGVEEGEGETVGFPVFLNDPVFFFSPPWKFDGEGEKELPIDSLSPTALDDSFSSKGKSGDDDRLSTKSLFACWLSK
jgi:hypothetical protein